jgi:hypothetical protein
MSFSMLVFSGLVSGSLYFHHQIQERTLQEVRRELSEVKSQLARLETKLNASPATSPMTPSTETMPLPEERPIRTITPEPTPSPSEEQPTDRPPFPQEQGRRLTPLPQAQVPQSPVRP